MRRHPFLLALLLSAVVAASSTAADQTVNQPNGTNGPSGQSPSAVTGKLKRNAADRDGSTPYVLLDRWGIVVGYVSPGFGVDLDRFLDQSLTINGTTYPSSDGVRRLRAEQVAVEDEAASPAAVVSPGSQKTTLRITQRSSERSARRPSTKAVRQAAYQEAAEVVPVPQGEMEMPAEDRVLAPRAAPPMEGPPVGPYRGSHLHGAPNGMADPSCSTCGPTADCGESCEPCYEACPRPCGDPRAIAFFPLSGTFWAKTEYLLWWTRGMMTPPLVTTGTPANAGILPAGVILYGNDRILGGDRDGGRFQIGAWLDSCHTVGVQGDYLFLEQDNEHYRVWAPGTPVISRPFFDVTPNSPPVIVGNPQEAVEHVSYPGLIDGSVSVDSYARFQSAGVSLRFRTGIADWVTPRCVRAGMRTDFYLGYRFLRLDDGITITEELTQTGPTPGFLVPPFPAGRIQDQFEARNQFHGIELGYSWSWYRGRWTFEFMPKVAFGNTHEIVDVSGNTYVTRIPGGPSSSPGGLLALDGTNIGRHDADQFAVVPEMGLTLAYHLTPKLKATVGYTCVYWSRVVRSAEQIDRVVNTNFQPGVPPAQRVGPVRPEFVFHDTGYWAQGLNIGLGYQW